MGEAKQQESKKKIFRRIWWKRKWWEEGKSWKKSEEEKWMKRKDKLWHLEEELCRCWSCRSQIALLLVFVLLDPCLWTHTVSYHLPRKVMESHRENNTNRTARIRWGKRDECINSGQSHVIMTFPLSTCCNMIWLTLSFLMDGKNSSQKYISLDSYFFGSLTWSKRRKYL